jgi:hypothetical protein
MGYNITRTPWFQLSFELGHMLEYRLGQRLSQLHVGHMLEPIPYQEQAGRGQLGDFRLRPEFSHLGSRHFDVTIPGGYYTQARLGELESSLYLDHLFRL